MADVVVTWPKTRALESYLQECKRALAEAKHIYYSLRGKPDVSHGDRCYIVHDGAIRGWFPITKIVDTRETGQQIFDPVSQSIWPPGIYLERYPFWTAIDPVPLKGFRGCRYAERYIDGEGG